MTLISYRFIYVYIYIAITKTYPIHPSILSIHPKSQSWIIPQQIHEKRRRVHDLLVLPNPKLDALVFCGEVKLNFQKITLGHFSFSIIVWFPLIWWYDQKKRTTRRKKTSEKLICGDTGHPLRLSWRCFPGKIEWGTCETSLAWCKEWEKLVTKHQYCLWRGPKKKLYTLIYMNHGASSVQISEIIIEDVNKPWCFTRKSLKQGGCPVKNIFLQAQINLNSWEFDWHKMYEDSVAKATSFTKCPLTLN